MSCNGRTLLYPRPARSRQVYACPPDACYLSAIGCAGHELFKKGTEGCVDSSAPGGLAKKEINKESWPEKLLRVGYEPTPPR
jgi:hypothetical protein